jgi:biotin synthase
MDITFKEAVNLLENSYPSTLSLADRANKLREKVHGSKMHLCSLINAKSGLCYEDCKFCGQSRHYSISCKSYPLLSLPRALKQVKEAEKIGPDNICIVTSGGALNKKEFGLILEVAKAITTKANLKLDCSLGRISLTQAKQLKKLGVDTYNHNLETASGYFSNICTTHTFNDRLTTVKRLKKAGLKVCCGGIIGLGENRRHRVELAFALKQLEVDTVPINILNPRPGTPLENMPTLEPMEIIRTIAVFRLILPKAIIKIAGGREHNLRDLQSLAFLAGANGMIIGGYLTTAGRGIQDDLKMVRDLGFRI